MFPPFPPTPYVRVSASCVPHLLGEACWNCLPVATYLLLLLPLPRSTVPSSFTWMAPVSSGWSSASTLASCSLHSDYSWQRNCFLSQNLPVTSHHTCSAIQTLLWLNSVCKMRGKPTWHSNTLCYHCSFCSHHTDLAFYWTCRILYLYLRPLHMFSCQLGMPFFHIFAWLPSSFHLGLSNVTPSMRTFWQFSYPCCVSTLYVSLTFCPALFVDSIYHHLKIYIYLFIHSLLLFLPSRCDKKLHKNRDLCLPC